MKPLFSLLTLSFLFSLHAAQAAEKPAGASKSARATHAAPKKTAPQLINLLRCPISGETVANRGKGGQIVGNYRVQLCCPDCAQTFAKLSAPEKGRRVAAMAAKTAKPRHS